MRHNLRLSPELLELTISNILDPRDLFDLALTCKGLYNLIVPYHLYFREIITIWDDHFDCALWNTISQRPILAYHTQTLQFVSPSSKHVGLGLAKSRARVLQNVEWTQGRSIIFETIPKIISKMVNLRTFMWDGSIFEGSILWSCIRDMFDGLDNCPNLTSLVVNSVLTGKDITLPFPAQQLSFLTTLALAVPCLCKSCASMPFYQKLLLEPIKTLQDVQLQLPLVPIHERVPMSSQWNDVFETVNWSNIRRLTLKLQGNDLRTSLSGPYPVVLETFIARHPFMESLAYYGNARFINTNTTLDFSFVLGNPSKLHSLKYVFSDCRSLPDIGELAHICDLQFVNSSFSNEQIKSMGSMPKLRFCTLRTGAQKSLPRFVRLFPGVEKLNIALRARHRRISSMSNYIVKLKGLNKLTHLAGLLTGSIHFYNNNNYDDYLKIAAETFPSLTHVEITHKFHNVWALIQRNTQGEYMGYEVMRVKPDGPPDWGLFFFGIPGSFYNGYIPDGTFWHFGL